MSAADEDELKSVNTRTNDTVDSFFSDDRLRQMTLYYKLVITCQHEPVNYASRQRDIPARGDGRVIWLMHHNIRAALVSPLSHLPLSFFSLQLHPFCSHPFFPLSLSLLLYSFILIVCKANGKTPILYLQLGRAGKSKGAF